VCEALKYKPAKQHSTSFTIMVTQANI